MPQGVVVELCVLMMNCARGIIRKRCRLENPADGAEAVSAALRTRSMRSPLSVTESRSGAWGLAPG